MVAAVNGVVIRVVGVEVDEGKLVLVSGGGLDQLKPQGSIEYCSPGCMATARAGLVTNVRKAIGRSIIVRWK